MSIGTHKSHCCAVPGHGCKYGDEDCPVVKGEVEQDSICEQCPEDGINNMTALRLVMLGATRTCPHCGHVLGDDKPVKPASEPLEDGAHIITYFGEKTKVNCDRKCGKAWGIQNRPKEQLSDDPDDYAFLADGELGEAPGDPGTYEGGHYKPSSPDEFPNKWCVRECERCSISAPGEFARPLEIKDFSVRDYNQPLKHPST